MRGSFVTDRDGQVSEWDEGKLFVSHLVDTANNRQLVSIDSELVRSNLVDATIYIDHETPQNIRYQARRIDTATQQD